MCYYHKDSENDLTQIEPGTRDTKSRARKSPGHGTPSWGPAKDGKENQ